MSNLWTANCPRDFWQCDHPFSDALWKEAIERALPILGLGSSCCDVDAVLEQVVGEGQFGPNHWTLSPAHRLYYLLKPMLPRALIRRLRQALNGHLTLDFPLG